MADDRLDEMRARATELRTLADQFRPHKLWERRGAAGLDREADCLEWCVAEIERLRDGIRRHRDAEGDDRCWLDDRDLYELLPEGLADHAPALPPRGEFLRSCERYWEQRSDGRVLPGCRTIAQLEAEIERLRAAAGA
jgi:hypothetical protein